jgi:serine/threonine protein kinase
MNLVRSSGTTLILGDRLGGGGEGDVYDAGRDLVAKVFHKPDAERGAKIRAMLANPPKSSGDHPILAWPIDALHHAGCGEVIGYLMPKIENPISLMRVMSVTGRKKAGMLWITLRHQMVIASNIATAFQIAHAAGYVIGDVNSGNVMLNQKGHATLIDTDSFQVPRPAGGVFRCLVGVAEYTPPELHGRKYRDFDRLEEHDRFGLAVLIYELLMQSNHPFRGEDHQGRTIGQLIAAREFPTSTRGSGVTRPPEVPALATLHPKLERLFVECFGAGLTDPARRPSAARWREALRTALGDLKQCSENPLHHFANRNPGCPWCEIRYRIQIAKQGGYEYFPPNAQRISVPQPSKNVPLTGGPVSPSPISFGTGSPGGPTSAAKRQWPQPSVSQPIGAPAPVTGGTHFKAPWTSTPSAPVSPSLISFGTVSPGGPTSAAKRQWPQPSVSQPIGPSPVIGGTHFKNPWTAPSATEPEVRPGRWQFQLGTLVPPQTWVPIVVWSDINLNRDGYFSGHGLLYCNGVRAPCQLVGTWQYNRYAKVLRFEAAINGVQAAPEQLSLIGGGNGQYQMTSALTGLVFGVTQLA